MSPPISAEAQKSLDAHEVRINRLDQRVVTLEKDVVAASRIHTGTLLAAIGLSVSIAGLIFSAIVSPLREDVSDLQKTNMQLVKAIGSLEAKTESR